MCRQSVLRRKYFQNELARRLVGRSQRPWTFFLAKIIPQIDYAHSKTMNMHPRALRALSPCFSLKVWEIQKVGSDLDRRGSGCGSDVSKSESGKAIVSRPRRSHTSDGNRGPTKVGSYRAIGSILWHDNYSYLQSRFFVSCIWEALTLWRRQQ